MRLDEIEYMIINVISFVRKYTYLIGVVITHFDCYHKYDIQ